LKVAISSAAIIKHDWQAMETSYPPELLALTVPFGFLKIFDENTTRSLMNLKKNLTGLVSGLEFHPQWGCAHHTQGD
jgi:hypothetical protein